MNKNPKHILIVSLAYTPFIGGAEIAIDEITKRIAPEDVVFHMLTLQFDKNLPRYEKIHNVHVYRIGWGMNRPSVSESVPVFLGIQKLLFPLIALPTALKIILKKNIESYWFMLLNTTTLLWYFLPKKKTVISLQDGRTIADHFVSPISKGLKPLFLNSIKRVGTVQGISNFIVRDTKKYRQGETLMIPNGVDLEKFTQDISIGLVQQTREAYGFSGTDKTIITVSRLVPSRGVEDSILALSYLPDHYKLLIVGEGHLKENLEQLVQDNNLVGRVVFVGKKSHNELIPIIKSCDVFVRASVYEGMGNAFIEAMAAGIPIIGTPVGGIPDFLQSGETGFFCESGKPETIADAVLKYEDQEVRNTIVHQAIGLVIKNYSWDIIAQRMQEILTK